MAYLRELGPYFAAEKARLAIGSVAGLVSNLAIVLPALALGRAIDATVAFGRSDGSRGAVATGALLFVGATAAHEVPKMAKRWWLNVAWAAMRASLRADAYRGALAAADPHSAAVGDSVARVVNDAELVAAGFGEVVFETWDTVVLSGTLLVAMVVLDPGLAAWALAPLPVAIGVAAIAGRFVASRTAGARRAAGAVATALSDQLGGLRVLRACGAVPAAVRRVEAASGTLTRHQLAVARIEEAAAPVAGFLLGAGAAIALWRGGTTVAAGGLSVGGLVAFLQLYARFAGRGTRVVRMVTTLRIGGAAYDRLRPLLATSPDHVAPPVSAPAGPVSVRLDGIGVDVPAGALVAVTGPIGSGKSTLCRALAASQPDLDVGYVPQEPPLFSGTVEENVLLGRAGDVGHALAVAGLDGELPLDTEVGEAGGRVSGGQRQRIALARAVAAAGDTVLVLDDPFSAVDVETEARIVAALRSLPATTVLASSRLAAFAAADLVVVLRGGQVAEMGPHAELMAAGGTYARIVAAQRQTGEVVSDGR